MENESKYAREELLANAKALFNVNPELISGALYGREETEFTKDEVADAIVVFMRREVK